MAIPSVMQGLIETEDGKVFELDSARGATWLETIGSFRYEPTGDGKPYTVRKEGKNGEYWYGCRKIEGKVRKKYIGKSSEVSVAKLDEIAEALEIPAEPRVKQVVEVAQQVAQQVAQTPQVVEQVAESRVTALELQVAALLKAVEAIQEALPGKSDAGNFDELPTVTDSELQIQLSNLQTDNQTLRQELEKVKADRAKLLESSSRIKTKLESEVRELRLKLETERADREEVESQLTDREEQMRQLLSELSDLKQKSKNDAARKNFPDFPEPADLLNQLKGKRKKSKVELADVATILEILEGV